MEPSDLNSSAPFDSKLEAQLRGAAGAPLADDGFSARVMAALPPPRRATLRHLWLLPTLGGAVGLAIALLSGASIADLTQLAAQVQTALNNPTAWSVGAIVIGLLAILFWRDGETT